MEVWSVGVSFGSGIRSIGRGHKVGTARPGERASRGALEDRRRVNANAEETRTFVLGASRAPPRDRGGGKGFRRAGGDSPMLASTIGCRAGAGGGFGGSGAGSVDVGFSIAPLTHSVAGSDARRYPPRATRSGRYRSLGFHENSYLGGHFKLNRGETRRRYETRSCFERRHRLCACLTVRLCPQTQSMLISMRLRKCLRISLRPFSHEC